MGLFDIVTVPCPICGARSEFQSKGSDDARCRTFTLEDAPLEVLSDINRHSPNECEDCGTRFEVGINQHLLRGAYYPKVVHRDEFRRREEV
jgi:transcription elongation factor Elf1